MEQVLQKIQENDAASVNIPDKAKVKQTVQTVILSQEKFNEINVENDLTVKKSNVSYLKRQESTTQPPNGGNNLNDTIINDVNESMVTQDQNNADSTLM